MFPFLNDTVIHRYCLCMLDTIPRKFQQNGQRRRAFLTHFSLFEKYNVLDAKHCSDEITPELLSKVRRFEQNLYHCLEVADHQVEDLL